MKKIFIFLSFMLLLTGIKAQMSGTYTIGSGGTYSSLTSAYNALVTNGVSGPVVLSVISDLSGQQQLSGSVSGASTTNTITITSSTGDANSFTVGTSTSSSLYLSSGVNNVIVKDLTIGDATYSSQQYGVYFASSTVYTNIEFRGCNINSSSTSTSSSYAAIYYNGSSSSSYYFSNVKFIKNKIRGGYYNINLNYPSGSSTNMSSRVGITIDSNELSDAYYYGIYSNYYAYYPSISYNSIKSRSNSSTYYGIYSYYYTTVDTMQSNRISVTGTSTCYGMYLYGYQNYSTSYGANAPMFIANNEIIVQGGSSTAYGLYAYGSTTYSRFDIFNNSIYVSNTSTAYGLYWYPRSSSYYHTFKNNIIHVNTSGTAYLFRFGSTSYMSSTYSTIDYNNYYRTGTGTTTYYGYGNSSYSSLSAWQSTSSQDLHTTTLLTDFKNVNQSLELTSYTGLTCPQIPGVSKDIRNNTRGLTCHKGCYEPFAVDAAVATDENFSFVSANNQSRPLTVLLKNLGLDTLVSATLDWSFKDTIRTPLYWTGSLNTGMDTLLTLGNIIPTHGNTNPVKIWVSNPNAITDQNHSNDTLAFGIFGCDSTLNGEYTVGGTGADFSTLSDAVAEIMHCGVNGPVTVKINNGVYNEAISMIGAVPGASSTNTVTFTSASGIADSVQIYATGNTWFLSEISNVYFNHLTIGTTTSIGEKAVVFDGYCSDIEFYACNLYADVNATMSSVIPVYYYSTSFGKCLNNVKFIKNNIKGGFVNMCLYTNNTVEQTNMGSVTIDSNIMTEGYSGGFARTMDYTSSYYMYFPSISYNTIIGRSNAASFQYGICLGSVATNPSTYGYYDVVDRIVGNRIILSDYNFYACGILLSTYQNYYSKTGISGAGTQCLVANNEIIDANANYYSYGIYAYYSKANLINNSIYLRNKTNSNYYLYGIWIYNSSTSYGPMTIKNNNIVVDPYEANYGYPMYFNDGVQYVASSYKILDYNNYYCSDGKIGYIGSDIKNLANWKSITGQDAGSTAQLPSFENLPNDLSIYGFNLACPQNTDVIVDIENTARGTTTIMGAYEFMPYISYDIQPYALVTPSEVVSTGVDELVSVRLMNVGTATVTSASINWSFNGVSQTVVNWSGSLTGGSSVVVVLDTVTPISGINNVLIYTSLPNDTMKFNDTLAVNLYACDSMLNGSYTVGTGGNFASIDDAFSIMNDCGINGPVELLLLSGTYSPLTIFGSVKGASAINTLTFTSFAGNADSVIIANTTTASNAMTLDRVSHLIFKDITIGLNSSNTRYALELKGMCEDVLFYGCKIQTYANSSSSSYIGVYYSNSSGSSDYLKNVRFIKNTIDGGYYNFYFYYAAGSSSNMSVSPGVGMSVFIDNNTMTNAYYSGIYSYYYAKYNSISYNTIQSRPGLSSNYYGVYTYYYTTIDSMIGNKILVTSSSTCYGMYLSRYQNYNTTYGAAGPMYIANNEVIVLGGSSSAYAFYENASSNYSRFDILHNSFYVSGSSTKYGVYVYPYSSSYKTTFLNNNIYVSTTSTGYMFQFGSTSYMTTSYCTFDYNNYYKPSGTTYYGSSSYTSLSAWQSGKSQDMQSTNINPGYATTPTDLVPTTATSLLCPLIQGVNSDITGLPRNVSNNNKGCYAKVFSLDASLTSFVSPLERSLSGTNTAVSVKLANLGTTTLTSVMIGWSVNGVVQTPVSLTGLTLTQMKDTTIVLGTFMPVNGTLTNVTAYTYAPNGSTDLNLLNDTLQINTYGCSTFLNGTYTVGSGKDFSSLNDVYTILHFCGVSGPVTFLLDSGTYPNIDIDEIFPGSSITNKITLTSASGDSNDVVFTSTSTGITFEGAAHIILHKIGIDVTSGTIGIQFIGYNEDIQISNCMIKASTTSSSSYRGISRDNGASPMSGIRILNNNIDGGYYGIYLYGSGSSDRNRNISINNNIINSIYYGIYTYYSDLDYVNGNIITQHALSTNSNHGMYLYYCYSKEIVGNIIKFDYNTGYGIYGSSFGAESASSRLLIANNELILTSNSSGRGIYVSSGQNYTDFYHNSILLKGSGQMDGCLYLLNSGTDVKIKNNILINLSGSSMSSTTYSFYTSQLSYLNTTTMDYNNYYTLGSNLMYASSALSNLDMWKLSTAQDANSISVLPNFNDTTYAHLHTDGFSMYCPVLVEVPKDINDTLRSIAVTNMGCYHDFKPLSLDAKLEMIESPTNSLTTGVTTAIEVKVANFGSTILDSVNIYYRINGGAVVKYAWTGGPLSIFNVSSTITLGSFIPQSGFNSILVYIAEPNAGVDLNTTNDTLLLIAYGCDSVLNGTYTVGTGGDFVNESEVMATLEYCGISGPVVFEFLSGTYGGLSFSSIPGSSATNTVTITSSTKKAQDVVFAVSVGDALVLYNASNLIFKQITLDASANINGSGITFMGSNTNMLFTLCNINASPSTTSSSSAAVYYSNSSGSTNFLKDIMFIQNNIDGGYYNFYMNYPAGSTTNMSSAGMSVTIDSNLMTNSYYYGIYSNYYARYPSISYNTITSRNSGTVSSYWYGMYLYYYHNVDAIVGNRIHSANQSIMYPYGLYMYYYFNSTSYNGSGAGLIANNEIILYTTSSYYGMYVYYPYSNVNIVHNSVYMYGTGNAYGLYTYNSTSSYKPVIKNNILVTAAGSSAYPIYYNGSYYNTSYFTVDYNNYYSTGSYIAYANSTSISSLSALQSATLQDNNSINIDPLFIDPMNDLQLANYTSVNCPKLSEVLFDIRKNIRSATTTMGCFEPYMLDAALNESDSTPISGIAYQTIPVSILLLNKGLDTLVSINIGWSLNGINQTPISGAGSLPTGNSTDIDLGYVTLVPGNANVVKVWINNVNGTNDQNASNDTSQFIIYGCDSVLNGIYTVGSTDADFATLEDAMFQLTTCGVNGPVELQFATGNYNSLMFDQIIPGSDSINTVCFTSLAGVADSVNFVSYSGVGLTLNGVSNLIFKRITIDAVYGTYGVDFLNTCNNILFYECNIKASPTSTSSNNIAVRYNQTSGVSTYLSNVRFIKNNISGGYYNFYLYYPCGSSTYMSQSSITIDSNTLTDAYSYGIYSYYYAYYPSISYNTITSRLSSSSFYGIYTYYYTTIDTMQSNKIFITASSTVYGIRFYRYQNYDMNYNARGPMFVANNEINILSLGTIYGIYAYGASYYSRWDIINNSVFTSASTNTNYGLYIYPCTNTGYKSTVFNNHIHVQTTSTAYPLCFASISYADTMYCNLDYNNYYTSGTESAVYIGSSSYNSLVSWQSSGYNQDLHAVNIAPVYLDSLTSLKYNYNSNLLSPQIAGILNDISGRTRSLLTSIGAYESDYNDLSLDSIVYPNYGEVFCQNSQIPVTISISNKGNTDYVFAEDSIFLHLRVSGAFTYAKDTTIETGSLLTNNSLNITVDNNLGLLNAGVADISVYLSHADANIGNDSLYTSIYINPSYRNYDTLRIGDNQLPTLYGDSVINSAGDYTVVFSTISNCDSIIDLHVIVDSTFHVMTTITLCDDELPYYCKDSIFTSAGNYDVFINASVGSDTVIHLTLIVNPTYIDADTLTICDSDLPLTYGDSILQNAGSYNVHFNTILGCDSLVVVKLYVNPTYAHTDTVTICDSELPLTYGDSILQNAGSYNVHFNTILGCDSLVVVQLNVNPTYIHADTVTICDSELPLTYGDSILQNAGSYNVHFNTVLGCDSLVVVQLYVNPTYDHTDTVTICDNELPLTYGDSILQNVGSYNVHFNTVLGCDSLVVVQLYVNPTYVKTDTLTICANELPYYYGDSVLTQAGDFEVHFNSIHACDSTINLTLYVKPTSGSNDTITICDSEFPYSYGDSIFNIGGNHQVYYTAVNGCDSVVELLLYVNPTYTKTDTVTICDTELPYTYGDSILTSDGSYDIHFASIEGCDSLIVLRLFVKPSFTDEDTITICDSELPYTYGDSVLTAGGSYNIHYTAINGCDSLMVLMLYVNPTYNQAETLDICDNQLPYFYGDSVFTAEGDYVIPYVSMYGCDSVINLRLNVFTTPTAPLKINGDTVITQAGNYNYYVDPVQGAQSYEWSISNPSWTGTSSSETISINIPAAGTATISVKAVNICGKSSATTLVVKSSVGISEKDGLNWSLGQNIPNPATATTLIPYAIPQDGKVVFNIMSINGQVLYSKHMETTAGSHLMEIDLNAFSTGIYYYSMEYQGKRIVKKMTIQK